MNRTLLTLTLLLSLWTTLSMPFVVKGFRQSVAEHVSQWKETRVLYQRQSERDVTKFLQVSLPPLPEIR